MPLVKTKSILAHATENKYGVIAANTFNFETVKWAVKAAEQERMPIIVQFYPGFNSFISQKFIADMAITLAQGASVPVAVHLDHSTNYDVAASGIKDGFPSIMVDGSALPYEQNVALTAAVVRAAHIFDVDVEAELGHVGSGSNIDDITNSSHFTDTNQARNFVWETGCDALAVAVGNAHGAYVQTPKLDFARIKAIRKAVEVPLVLHGSSDIPDEQIQEAVNLGISKFNLATEYFRAYYNALDAIMARTKRKDAYSLVNSLEEPMVEFMRGKIRLLNPNKFSL
ncbi:MAG: class II fructose-bisphosphate aldolase [Firmicutes bacterium]|nr:class II fructose-bisphosphate aldolase [Bacillota bacterium]